MEETDKRIESMAEVNDRETVWGQMTEALGLRGHLQDELLRIQAMLVEDDPNLNNLNFMESQYPKVVSCLRDLAEKAKVLNALRTDLPDTRETADPRYLGVAPSLLRTIEERVEEVERVAAQTGHFPGSGEQDECNITAGDLKVKHQVEEQTVSETFADRVLRCSSDDPGAIHRLLHDHSVSMQALRTRQSAEREQIAVIQETYPQLTSETGYGMGNATEPLPQTENVKQVCASYVSEIRFGNDGQMQVLSKEEMKNAGKKPVGKATVITKDAATTPRGGTKFRASSALKKKSMDEVDSDDDINTLVAAVNKSKADDTEKDFGSDDEFSAPVAGLKNEENSPPVNNNKTERNDLDQRGDQERIEELTAEMEEALKSKDEEFIKKLNAARANGEDVDELLRRHLEEAEAIRRQKFAERAKLDEKLKELLGNKKRKNLEEMDDEVEDKIDSLSKNLLGEFNENNMSSVNIDDLLAEHRKRQMQIIKTRVSQNDRLNDKLNQKLEEYKRRDLEKDTSRTADELIEELQALNLDQPEIQEKLRQYLNMQEKPDNVSLQRRKRQEEKDREEQEAADAQQTASSLVTDHKQKAKQIRVSREREKQVLDQKLQAALKKKKREQE